MFSINTILVPIFDPETFRDSRRLMNQLAWLARRFRSEIVLLHVVSSFDYPAGLLESGNEITERDLNSFAIQRAESGLAELQLPELDGITVTRLLLRGNPARQIVQTALDRNAALIAMPASRDKVFYEFLSGSVTSNVLSECACPVWMGSHLDEPSEPESEPEFSIRHILCSIDLTPHNRHTVALAAEIAAAAGAKLTLVHVTSGVEVWGPGGMRVDPAWKKALTGIAAQEIAKLQQELGTNADVIIDSGNVPELLNRAADNSGADVLVIGRIPGRSHLGNNGHGHSIVRESSIPVLSV